MLQWNADPSGTVRRGLSIQTAAGQPVQDRASDRCSAPVRSTANPGRPRLSIATDTSASPRPPSTRDGPISTVASARSAASSATAAASSESSRPASTSTGRARSPRRSALGSHTAGSGRSAGTQTRARPVAASCRSSSAAGAGAAASTAAVNALRSGPPTAIRVSGRLESTRSAPYRLPVSSDVVEVTPARTSATTRSRTPASDPASATTSATPTAVAIPPATTRAVEPTPNQEYAGLSRVHGCSAESTSTMP